MYFKYFPQIQYPYYDTEEKLIKKSSKNVTLRVKFSEYLKNYKTNFEEYTIRDSERPDTLAYRLYDRSDLHWIFFIINDIINPYYSWPLSNRDLQSFIDEKYKGSSFFVPNLWKDLNQYDFYTGSLEGVNSSTVFTSGNLDKKIISELKIGDDVKISFNGQFFDTKILDIREKFYEITLGQGSWNSYSESNRYFYYEVDYYGVTTCIRIPITRIIDFKRYSVYQFNYNEEYRDPGMVFEKGLVSYHENPYNFFVFSSNIENITNGNFINPLETNRSFSDVFAIKDDDGEYMDAAYYKTNEVFESELNESKRKILVPKPKAVEEILKQMKSIFIA